MFRPRACLPLVALLLTIASVSPAQDLDGDGWDVADGDCADVPGGLITRPEWVNPGAYDDPFNGIDDDCDGTVDNPTPTNCSAVNLFGTVTASFLANALDICQTTTASPPLPVRRWGMISAQLLRASGALAPSLVQAAVKQQYGQFVLPVGNATMAVLSSGSARDATDPGFISPAPGFQDVANVVVAPTDFTTPNGGLYQAGGCPQAGNTVYDSARLKLILRVPTNANGFVFSHRFFASDYPNTCMPYNDHLIALLTSAAPGVPANKNVLFDSQANPMTLQTAFFDVCTGCNSGDQQLTGTGYPMTSGGTQWVTSAAPVLPGETITLEFHIWDSGDGQMDALALLDNFQWLTLPQDPVTGVGNEAAPAALTLRASPNPFVGRATVDFGLPRAGRVTLEIFDVTGRRIRSLVAGEFPAGLQRVAWDGRDDEGREAGSGSYFVRLRSGAGAVVKRLVLGN